MLQRLIKLNHNWFSIFLPKCDLPTPTVFPISINGQNIESSSTPFSHNPHLTYQKISLALPFFFSLGRVSDLLKCDKYDVNRNLETNKIRVFHTCVSFEYKWKNLDVSLLTISINMVCKKTGSLAYGENLFWLKNYLGIWAFLDLYLLSI